MQIETITDRASDTEICISCPECKFSCYFDPRAGKHCCGCEDYRRTLREPNTCPECGACSGVQGDLVWVETLRRGLVRKGTCPEMNLPEPGNLVRIRCRDQNYEITWQYWDEAGRETIQIFDVCGNVVSTNGGDG